MPSPAKVKGVASHHLEIGTTGDILSCDILKVGSTDIVHHCIGALTVSVGRFALSVLKGTARSANVVIGGRDSLVYDHNPIPNYACKPVILIIDLAQ